MKEEEGWLYAINFVTLRTNLRQGVSIGEYRSELQRIRQGQEPRTAAATAEGMPPLAAGFEGVPTRAARPGGCGVQVEAPRKVDADPAALVRAAYPGWSEDLAQAAAGPEGERFTLQREGVQCTTTFAWGPMGARADVPWTARVDCSRRPGR